MRIAISCVWLLACGGGTPAPRTEPRPAPARAAAAPAPAASSALTRADVDAVLQAGIPAFLSRVEIEPEAADGRFVGFRVVSFFPGDARFSGGPIRAGDVVLAVNGLAIERPEHLFRVWQELRVASEISVDLVRAGRPTRLSYPIE